MTIITVIVHIVVLPGWTVNHYRDNATEYKKQRDEKAQALSLANATITNMTTRQHDVIVLDAKYTKELADARKRPDGLQRYVRDDRYGLHIDAKCPANGATSTDNMDDASGPRLTDSAQRDYFTFRERIVTVAKQAGCLQDCINTQYKRLM